MELSLTARRFPGFQAKALGLVTMVYSTKEALEEGVAEIADADPKMEKKSFTNDVVITLKSSPYMGHEERRSPQASDEALSFWRLSL